MIFCDGSEKYLSERFWDGLRGGPLMAITLCASVGETIRAHGAEAYPNECCGAMCGRDGVVSEVFRLLNTDEGSRHRFLVRPVDYREVEKRTAVLGLDLMGFYHSHPDHPARPSQYDLDHAWPFFSYVIVSVHQGVPQDMTSWLLQDDRSAFSEEMLTHGD